MSRAESLPVPSLIKDIDQHSTEPPSCQNIPSLTWTQLPTIEKWVEKNASGTPPQSRRASISSALPNSNRLSVLPPPRQQQRNSFQPMLVSIDAHTKSKLPPSTSALPPSKSATMDESDMLPPTLPERNALRVSRLPPNIATDLGLQSLASPISPKTPGPLVIRAESHDLYLSSEEDVTSSADECSDYDPSESEQSANCSPKRRESQEESAKMVTVVHMGRPSIVTLSPVRSNSPSLSVESAEPKPLERAATDSQIGLLGVRCVSMAGEGSAFQRPPRSSSMFTVSPLQPVYSQPQSPASLHPPSTASSSGSTVSADRSLSTPDMASSLPRSMPAPKKSLFVNVDPFNQDIKEQRDGEFTPRTPLTPTGMIRRGLNLVRKRSTPFLSSLSATPKDSMPPPPLPHSNLHQLSLDDVSGASIRKRESHMEPPFSATLPAAMSSFTDLGYRGKDGALASSPISNTNSPSKPSKGRILGFRRQSLSFRPGLGSG